jgi:alkanesulfonate monooxygenase SsuD/methylene tetrahydromethanopterin reductase-like flavin-dependent oxidoreductase (luciferase family)
MTDKPFQFGLIAMPEDGPQFLGLARNAEDLGYAALVMPDGLRSPSPFPALGLAAGATTTLRVGTWVAASPLRPPRLAAWDAHTLWTLTGGRFEFGIGTGRPDVADDAVNLLGQEPLSPAGRLAQVERTIDELRALDPGARIPVTIAAGGPKARALAAAKADRITLAAGPFARRDEVAALAAEVREQAGERAGEIEFAAPIFVAGHGEAPPSVGQFLGGDAATLIERDSLMILPGGPREMADELQRRRETLGVSYFVVSGFFIEEFAPVVELLAGR